MGRDAYGRFKAGEPSCLTQEEKLRKAQSMSVAWKSRKDYIGDIKDIHPRIHGCWRGIRFTVKGKAVGCSKEWPDFRSFYNDVAPSYKNGLILRRKDTSKPWGPENFMWVEPSFVGDLRSFVTITHNGETLNIRQWGEKLGVPYELIKQRYYRHKDDWTAEEIFFGKKKRRNTKPAKDISDPSVTIRAKASKMIASYRNKDIKNGTDLPDMDIDWMVENILTKPCVYCGDTHRIGCDRIDNTKGHTKDNVVPCCIECNTARNIYFTYEEMRRIGRVIAEIKAARPKNTRERTIAEIRECAARDKEYVRTCCMRKVYQYTLDGEFVAEYQSEIEAAKRNNVSVNAINAATNGNGYKKSYNGHKLINYLWYNERTIKDK